jgi:hypothetical protein
MRSLEWNTMTEHDGGVADETVSTASGLIGCFVSSDRQRNSSIYRVSVDTLVDYRAVGLEEVFSTRMVRDASGQWQISNRTAGEGHDRW